MKNKVKFLKQINFKKSANDICLQKFCELDLNFSDMYPKLIQSINMTRESNPSITLNFQ